MESWRGRQKKGVPVEMKRVLGTRIGERAVEKELGKGEAPEIGGSAKEGRGLRGGKGVPGKEERDWEGRGSSGV